MKHKISVSIDENTLLRLKELKRSNRMFRNQSHVIEYAIEEFLERKSNQP